MTAVERQRAATDVVERPAGCRHHDVDAAVAALQLPEDRLAAVDRHDLDAERRAVLEDGLADLHRKLAGGHEHQRDRVSRAAGIDVLQRRQRERRGLAGAGRGLAEQILTGDQVWDRLTLNRRRLFVAQVLERGEGFGAQAECGKALVCGVVRGIGHRQRKLTLVGAVASGDTYEQ